MNALDMAADLRMVSIGALRRAVVMISLVSADCRRTSVGICSSTWTLGAYLYSSWQIRESWCIVVAGLRSRKQRVVDVISAGVVVQEAENSSAGVFIPSGTAQRSTGNERLCASNQEPPGHHVTREHQWGATVLLLVRPRKVGVT